MEKKEVKLRVGELTHREEAGRGIARIDSATMQKIGVKEGDIIEIEGNRKTAAIAVRAYPADVGLNIIRIDGITRRNAGTGIGEYVTVRKADYKEARKVVLAPAQKGVVYQISGELVKQNLMGRPVVKGDIVVPTRPSRRRETFFEEFFGIDFEDLFFASFPREMRFVVVNTEPEGIVKITDMTDVEVLPTLPKHLEEKHRRIPAVTYEDIGDMKDVIKKVREMIELPLRHPELFARLGIEPPKGILLYGPPGTGKTLLAKAVANESNAHFISISGPEVTSKWYGETEKRIREIFEEAEKNAPSIIFIDEIDAIAPKREEVVGEVERRMVAQLLASMDGLKSRGRVIVIAATNRPNAIDPALRRPGRFDREIEVPVPDREGRLEILKIHTRNMPLADDVDLEKIAERTHGFVGADLMALCKEAAMNALRRVLPEVKWGQEKLPKEVLEKLVVTMKDFEEALKVVEPSAMREVLVEIPKVKWEDIGDLENVKQALKEMVEWPLKHPDAFKRLGIEPPKGILLYGPPGTGKTLLAKAVANESGANFISVKGPELLSMWFGESERRIRELFKRARQVAPCIIFFDEIDALVPRRGYRANNEATERIVSQLLTEMSGIEDAKNVFVIAATNRPDIVDPALLRPGRIDRIIYVPPPDKKGRLEILKIHTRNMPLADDVDLEKIAERTENYSGADLEALCKEAAMAALREDINAKEVKAKHFEEALKKVTPSLTPEMIKFYKAFEKRLKKRLEAKPKNIDLEYIS